MCPCHFTGLLENVGLRGAEYRKICFARGDMKQGYRCNLPGTGELKAEHQPNSSNGGSGDKLHRNPAGYMAMGLSVDPKITVGS